MLETELEPKQKVVLVTGGAKGIGRGIVLHLVKAGWQVVFCDTDVGAGEALVASYPRHLLFVHADVASEPAVAGVIAQALDWAGGLDAVINNAGIADPDNGPVEELSLEQWQRRLDVNLTGPFLVTKYAVPHLRKAQGAIVNMASTRALQSEPDTEAYAATKGGLVALTHALAVSLGPDIRVNCISPGWIDTRDWQGSAETALPLQASDHRQHPAGRVGTPEDIASLVAYLISPEAAFITGQNFVVDGGMTRKMIYED
ncbi:SDR family oxidoreductase [Marinobacter sp. KM021]|uniref:SDR family oxidoreductase n=1 Tax=Marinobacter sp. KM021 TaxID=3075616 RepID=UPI003D6A4D87